MKITQITLRNFKRFTDLTITDIPPSAKLVVIVGPNGSGKSSIFDALNQWHRMYAQLGWLNDELYYKKLKDQLDSPHQSVQVKTDNDQPPSKNSLYIRTAYRNEPDFTIGGITKLDSPVQAARFHRLIENDIIVSENYQRLVYETIAGVYDPQNDYKTVIALREELIGSIRYSMRNVFGDLVLNNIADPLGSGSFFFQKGSVASYHYKNLSGGEKAVFDLLLDIHVKRRFFQEAVYCIDEIETHLHSRAQGPLLREMVNILPNESQLWITTHSLGVLRAAYEMGVKDPEIVCVIDLDGVDLDAPAVIVPSSLGRVTWDKLLSIALDDLSTRIAPRVVVVCEGSSIGNRRKDYDAEIYNRILGSQVADVIFVSGGSASQVAATGASIRGTLRSIMPSAQIYALCDRDSKSPQEVTEFERDSGIVLPVRNLESYLFAEDVIEALVRREGKEHLLNDALNIRKNALRSSVQDRRNPPDDLKSAAGQIYNELRPLLSLTNCGNTADAFMRDTLAPLIAPPMTTYAGMKAAIMDRLP